MQMMSGRLFGAMLVMLSVGLPASAQTNSDPLQALKDTLSGGSSQQGSILQGVLGDTSGTGKKSDKKLESPETVQPPSIEDMTERNIKTRDGRILRQMNEDPELRADDPVMIEIRTIDDVCDHNNAGLPPQNGVNNQNNPPNGANGATAANALSGLTALSSTGGTSGAGISSLSGSSGNGGLGGLGGLGGINGTNGINGIGGINGINGNNPNLNNNWIDLSRCPLQTEKPKTDEEKADLEKFQKRILGSNPYKLNRFGILELPGLPATPLAGLTASEATKRLSADPELNDFFVRVTLLRLMPSGQEALKPFGYDLFEGVPST